MMGESFVRIERFDNGFTVEIRDPAIDKANKARDEKVRKPNEPYPSWKDPWKTFVFKTDKEVVAFLTKNLKKAIATAKPSDEYSGSFDLACEGD